jgi:uncharacterized tellurite resistance protein B-like protein
MLDDILHYFTGYGTLEFDKDGHASEEALKVATAAILWESSLADNELDAFEVGALTEIMRSAFNISEKEVEIISAICKNETSREKMDQFIATINKNFDTQQRETIIEFAAQIARASQDVSISEALVCDVLRARLNVT